MAFEGHRAVEILEKIGNANNKSEYYLPDAVAIVRDMGLRAAVIETSEDEVRGINTKAQLAEAEAVMQARLRQAALDRGVTMIAPDTVYLAADTTFGNDVTIEPFVVIGPGVSIADGAVIHAFSHLVQARIGKNASVGPYARLRPGTSLGEGARIGNFVETKAAVLEAGVKVNHLTYIGDTDIGAGANIGAGTITCNYDGFGKHKTTIGAGAFVGSNSSLVAPVKFGSGAYIGSGSVITKDVPDDTFTYDAADRLVSEDAKSSGLSWSFAYDHNGSRTGASTTDGTQSRSFVWDAAGDLASFSDGSTSSTRKPRGVRLWSRLSSRR